MGGNTYRGCTVVILYMKVIAKVSSVYINLHCIFIISQYLFSLLFIVIQFGFVTLFVASFPLAPLFALLNNYAEIRLDAFKYLCLQRKVVAIRAADIGVWYSILDIVAKCAVVSNVSYLNCYFIRHLLSSSCPDKVSKVELSRLLIEQTSTVEPRWYEHG